MKIANKLTLINYANKKNSAIKLVLITLFLTCLSLHSMAQLNPFQSMYYQDRYQLNPAFAGMEKGLTVNIDYMQQWSSFPGTPKTSSLTAEYLATSKVGLGVDVDDDESGLIRTTRMMGSYAYHLQTSERNDHLNFGLSLGVNDSRVDYSKIVGDPTDDEVAQYDALKPYVDGDLGVAYTSDNLMVSGTLPNLKSTFFSASDSRFDADLLLFMGAVSYKFKSDNQYTNTVFEPLVAFRAIKKDSNILDAGFNFDMINYGLDFQAIYHTNQEMSAGFGFDVKPFLFSFNYNFETGPLSNYTNGAFEFGMRLRLPGKAGQSSIQ